MPDLPRYRSPRSQSRPSGRPAYDRYKQDDDRDPRNERGRGDLRVQSQSRPRSRHGEDKARPRRARYPEAEEAELEWRRLRYREEDRQYERALRASPRSPGKRSRDSWSDSREYDEMPARYSRRSDRWLTGYWSKVHFPSHVPDKVSRYMEKVQTVFTRSMRAAKRAENRLLERFAQLQPWQRVAIAATYIVRANIGANKGSIYVSTKANETITLDSAGDAHHDLTVTMFYHPTGAIYGGGLDTMRDYIRVYVPSQSKYGGGSGFDETTSNPLCYSVCMPRGAPVCQATHSNPTGAFLPGAYAPSFPRSEGSGIENGYGYVHTDAIGGPTNFTSDELGRAMFGGLIVIPAFCTATWTLHWTVPHSAAPASSQNVPYTFTLQHQSGIENEVIVTIKPASSVNARAIDLHVAAQLADLTLKLASG